jgi:hypothetical protein
MADTPFNRIIADKQRFVPLIFTRAQWGQPPHPDYPDIDDRGFAAPYEGPVVGIAEGRTIMIRMIRLNVGDSVKLYLKSSDEGTAKLVGLADGLLPSGDTDFQIQGVKGDPVKTEAKITVHFESLSGPVIGQLFVQIYALHTVDIVNHILTIDGRPPGKATDPPVTGTTPYADVDAVFTMAQTIWRHYGVELNEVKRLDHRMTLAKADQMQETPLELGQVLGEKREKDRINVYFIRQIGTGQTLGYGFSTVSAKVFKTAIPDFAPGIILADRTASQPRANIQHWANDYAHEVGHFFTLWHPGVLSDKGDQGAVIRQDTWARRMLMHNSNLMSFAGYPADAKQNYRPRFNDVGYGLGCRGCMVTIKDVPGLKTDGEVDKSRSAIARHKEDSKAHSIYEIAP